MRALSLLNRPWDSGKYSEYPGLRTMFPVTPNSCFRQSFSYRAPMTELQVSLTFGHLKRLGQKVMNTATPIARRKSQDGEVGNGCGL